MKVGGINRLGDHFNVFVFTRSFGHWQVSNVRGVTIIVRQALLTIRRVRTVGHDGSLMINIAAMVAGVWLVVRSSSNISGVT